MSFLPTPVACDVCKAQKKDVNHWFFADMAAERFEIYTWAPEAEDRSKHFTHLCGHVCAVKKLSEWMGQQGTCATVASGDTLS